MRKRKPGRPKGSKNKKGHHAGRPRTLSSVAARIRRLDLSEFPRRGRPKGSKNKPTFRHHSTHVSNSGHVVIKGTVKFS